MSGHPALQDSSLPSPPSPEAVALASRILDGDLSLDAAIAAVASHLLGSPRIDVVATALTQFTPETESDWTSLGGRAWLREWVRPDFAGSILPTQDAGPEAALSMPWISPRARADAVALSDRELLPDEARQDRAELERLGIRSVVVTALAPGGEMFGSLSMASRQAGTWPLALLQDFRLLRATISSRLALAQSQRALAAAIAAGADARDSHQQFVASVGHELRTPLAAIVGYTEILLQNAEDQPDDPMSATLLQDGPAILRACDQLDAVTDSLLGTGRTLSAGDTRQDVQLAEAVADVAHWHRTPATTARVEVLVDVDDSTTVWAHPSGVRQVLSNLLTNAIAHHRPGGTVRISAQSLLGESGQDMVRIIVRDDGPGLTADQLARAFEPFVRFATTGTVGSGLGLPLSRTIAERDGGTVHGESTPGVGSAFWVELPAAAPPHA